jgi:hypothetical protein
MRTHDKELAVEVNLTERRREAARQLKNCPLTAQVSPLYCSVGESGGIAICIALAAGVTMSIPGREPRPLRACAVETKFDLCRSCGRRPRLYERSETAPMRGMLFLWGRRPASWRPSIVAFGGGLLREHAEKSPMWLLSLF